MGGTSSGKTKIRRTTRLNRKFRRAKAYAAGTPSRSEIATTANTTSTVTVKILSSWNSLHAVEYHRNVKPLGNQVPSQVVAKELTTTTAITARTLRTKKPIATQTIKREK